MTMMRWEPMRDIENMQREMERFFEEYPLRRWWMRIAGAFSAAVDLYETDDKVVIKASLRGVTPDDLLSRGRSLSKLRPRATSLDDGHRGQCYCVPPVRNQTPANP